MHYAVHGHTAAELIVERADHTREHMGLTTWADAPEGKIKKSDVTVAKNYLSQDEMKQLNRMVTVYLDLAENMTLRHIPLTMQGKCQLKLQSFMPRLNLKNIVSFRIDYLCLILISICWNWKRMRRSSNIAIKFLAYQGRVHGSWVISQG